MRDELLTHARVELVRRRLRRSTAFLSSLIPHPSALRCSLRSSLLLFVLHVGALNALAGGAWTPQSSGTLAWLHAVYFLDENRGWAVGGNGVLLTTVDGGASWKAMRRPTEDALRDIYFADERTGWL